MPHYRHISLLYVCPTLLAACATLAPGADKVQLTKSASDVASCTAVGNIHVPPDEQGGLVVSVTTAAFRNQVIGFGGNTGFITSNQLGAPVDGIAYRCPQTKQD
jgi:hypothetical protein